MNILSPLRNFNLCILSSNIVHKPNFKDHCHSLAHDKFCNQYIKGNYILDSFYVLTIP